MALVLRAEDTPEARQIWDTVEEVSKRCPEWIRPQVEAAALEFAKRTQERWTAMAQNPQR